MMQYVYVPSHSVTADVCDGLALLTMSADVALNSAHPLVSSPFVVKLGCSDVATTVQSVTYHQSSP